MAKRRMQKIPMMAMGGVALTVMDLVFGKATGYDRSAYEYIKLGGYQNAGKILMYQSKELSTWVPLIAGVAGSSLASKFGVNQKLSAIPYVKL